MFFSDKIKLRAESTTRDSFGEPIISYTDTEVWADVKSVARSEFYASHTAGIKADIMFAVHNEDYSNQQSVLYNGNTYIVQRSYVKAGNVELTCVRRE